MTDKQEILVKALRLDLLRANYPTIYVVNNETLEAVEKSIEELLIKNGEDPILVCGKNRLLFKGVELVLEAK